MLIFRSRNGLLKGGVYIAIALGVANGYYFWKPLLDPAEKHKLLKYQKPNTSGNDCWFCVAVE